MLGLSDAASGPLRNVLDAPIRWLIGSAIDPQLERPFEYIELVVIALIIALVVLFVWEATSAQARERKERELQERWRQRLRERNRRIRFENNDHRDERLGS